MHRSCINGSDVRAQIYGGQVFPDPPDRSTFNGGGGGGGGPESEIMYARIWTAQVSVPRSTVYIGFRTPPSILPLMEGGGGGGGPECVLKITHRSAVERKARRSTAQGIFRTPPTDLPLTVGGGGGGSGMEFYSGGPPIYTWHESIGPESHRLLLSDIPRHLMTSLSTFSIRVTSRNSVSPSPSFTRGKSLHHGLFPQSITTTSLIRMPQSLSPAISRSK
jgi:hypothetical protein